MKCVREDFCDADGVMVPYRVSLTDQEKRIRGTLIVSNAPINKTIDPKYSFTAMHAAQW